MADEDPATRGMTLDERALEQAFAQAGVGAWRYRVGDAWFWASAAVLDFYGFDAGEPVPPARSVLERVHPEDRHAIVQACRDAIAGDAPNFIVEHRVVGPTGQTRWLRGTGSRMVDANGHIELFGTATDITQAKLADRERARSEQRYRLLIDLAPEAIVVIDPITRRFIDANPSAERLFGLTRRRLLERGPAELSPTKQHDGADSESTYDLHAERALRRGSTRFEWRHRDADAREIECEVQLVRFELEDRIALRGSIVDVTERRRLQSVLDQRSRLESLGRLAGGVAHDFNNLLTAIRGHAELAQRRGPDDDRYVTDLQTIERAATRAGDLTRQLLVFARRHRVEPRPLVLNDEIREAARLLEPLMPANVRMKLRLESDLWPVSIDPNQLEQVVLNLALNARDAMRSGGKITIRTGNLRLGEEDTGYAPGVPVGDWVVLSVADTGSGIPKDLLDHVFEPFFTTKDVDRGTGLGLATCHSIVQHAGGRLIAESVPDMGSIFRAFLPRAEVSLPAETETPRAATRRGPPQGQGTILVVEDEPMVREVAVLSLRAEGYDVLEASDAEHALSISRRHEGPVDLLVTDVVMPGLAGPQLARRLLEMRPEVPVLYVSGYVADVALPEEGGFPRSMFLPKPYTPDQLGEKVRELLRRR